MSRRGPPPGGGQDKEVCGALYARVRAAVEGGIEELRAKRAADPIRELLPRLLLNVAEGWDGR